MAKQYIIGADEVGRGSWAGSLVVCAIKAPPNWKIDGLKDSKKLTPKRRENICEKINQYIISKEITFALAERSNAHIDQVGLGMALKECFVECFKQLYDDQSSIIVDGNMKFEGLGIDDYDIESVVKADNIVPAVMAGANWAKVYRDQKMRMLHKQYPMYDWFNNKGYHSASHVAGLEQHGISPLHRKSFAPIKNIFLNCK